ncbi:MAG TPA: J domain-containing protein [Hyphomonadaceae bacterium]|nr:J domain-containing protein [Hyphomonadaceae bacterium]
MSFAEDYMRDYRVKFVDIRVNPPGGRQRKRPGDSIRRCEAKGCDDLADCKAPKPYASRTVHVPGQRVSEEDSHWFCQRHAAEYNQSYDFFEGMTEAEITAFQASAGFGHKPTWRFGGGAVGAAGRAARMNNPRSWRGAKEWLYNGPSADRTRADIPRDRTRLQLRALDEMGLPPTAESAQIRERYGVLIKQYHPDSNGGDRSMEHRLHIVIRAFKALKASGLA